MAIDTPVEDWPAYTYIVPQLYTPARVRLAGFGAYVPRGRIQNEFFAFIATRLGYPRKASDFERATGLVSRRVRACTLDYCRTIAGAEAPGLIDEPDAPREESLTDMALLAARRGLASAGWNVRDIDMIIATSSSDNEAFPTMAGLMQARLGCRHVRASTLKGACACVTEAFQMAADALSASTARRVLIVAADAVLANTLHVLDWRTSLLFGEGAAAFLLERGETADDLTYAISGYDASAGHALRYQTLLRRDALTIAQKEQEIMQLYRQGCAEELDQILIDYQVGYASMSGNRIYEEAPRAMAECVDILCRHAHISPAHLAHIIPHQANSRIVRRIGELLIQEYNWPETTAEKLADHYHHYGNLSNASIGLALVETLRSGKLQPGQWIALPSVGGGMHYGGWLLRYRRLHDEAQALQLA